MHINSFQATQVKLMKFGVIASTNDLAKELIQNQQAEEGMVIWADEQLSGRGQQGTTWESQSGQNLLCTLILQPSFLSIEQQVYLNMAIALALCEAIQAYVPQKVYIKWPNDIYVEEQKVAGILIENTLQGNALKYAIIGFGINVNQQTHSHAQAASISLLLGVEVNRELLLSDVLSQIERQYTFLRLKQFEKLRTNYHQNLLGWNQLRTFDVGDGAFEAHVEGVDEHGRLLLKHEGKTHHYLVKQVKWL